MKLNPMLTAEQIQQAFPTPIEPVQTTWRYRLDLLGLLLTLLSQQAIYIARIVGAGAATLADLFALPAILMTVKVNWLTLSLVLAPPVDRIPRVPSSQCRLASPLASIRQHTAPRPRV